MTRERLERPGLEASVSQPHAKARSLTFISPREIRQQESQLPSVDAWRNLGKPVVQGFVNLVRPYPQGPSSEIPLKELSRPKRAKRGIKKILVGGGRGIKWGAIGAKKGVVWMGGKLGDLRWTYNRWRLQEMHDNLESPLVGRWNSMVLRKGFRRDVKDLLPNGRIARFFNNKLFRLGRTALVGLALFPLPVPNAIPYAEIRPENILPVPQMLSLPVSLSFRTFNQFFSAPLNAITTANAFLEGRIARGVFYTGLTLADTILSPVSFGLTNTFLVNLIVSRYDEARARAYQTIINQRQTDGSAVVNELVQKEVRRLQFFRRGRIEDLLQNQQKQGIDSTIARLEHEIAHAQEKLKELDATQHVPSEHAMRRVGHLFNVPRSLSRGAKRVWYVGELFELTRDLRSEHRKKARVKQVRKIIAASTPQSL